MFSHACVILFKGGCLPQCMLGYTPPEQTPPKQTPPQSRHPPEQTLPRADNTLLQSRHPLGADNTPRADTPGADTPLQTPPRVDTPSPGADTSPPPHRACWEIRSTRGRYASYWNAILFKL